MKTNYKIILLLLLILVAFSSCDKPDEPCILRVEVEHYLLPPDQYGLMQARVFDGLEPITYLWSDGTTQDAVDLNFASPDPEDYSVTVTDNLGCTATASFVNSFCGTNTTVTDNEGNMYKIVSIGSQCWMAENLRISAGIPEVADETQWGNLTTPAWCFYDNNSSNGATYGKLYNWYAVNTGNLCPSGWHIPTDAEWQDLVEFHGGIAEAGARMKSLEGWAENQGTLAFNSYLFTALPGGSRNISGSFVGIGYYGVFWSSTENSTDQNQAWGRELSYNSDGVNFANAIKARGYSCRCVKD